MKRKKFLTVLVVILCLLGSSQSIFAAAADTQPGFYENLKTFLTGVSCVSHKVVAATVQGSVYPINPGTTTDPEIVTDDEPLNTVTQPGSDPSATPQTDTQTSIKNISTASAGTYTSVDPSSSVTSDPTAGGVSGESDHKLMIVAGVVVLAGLLIGAIFAIKNRK